MELSDHLNFSELWDLLQIFFKPPLQNNFLARGASSTLGSALYNTFRDGRHREQAEAVLLRLEPFLSTFPETPLTETEDGPDVDLRTLVRANLLGWYTEIFGSLPAVYANQPWLPKEPTYFNRSYSRRSRDWKTIATWP